MRMRWSVALLPALLLGGCGKEDSVAPDPTGTFTATFSGTLVDTTSGRAEFGNPSGLHVVRLSSAQPAAAILILSDFGIRLGSGEHTVSRYRIGVPYAYVDFASGELFHGIGGSVSVDSSTPTSIIGAFNIIFASSDSTDTMTVTGNFNARCNRGNIITCTQ